jgi:hypothetical protein
VTEIRNKLIEQQKVLDRLKEETNFFDNEIENTIQPMIQESHQTQKLTQARKIARSAHSLVTRGEHSNYELVRQYQHCWNQNHEIRMKK